MEGDNKASESLLGEHLTRSVEETQQLAGSFAQLLCPGSWVGLVGPLGSGKSVFARAIGGFWGVTEPMPSPTYTLMNCHQGRCQICHMDLYRIGEPDELDFAGLGPYFSGPGICLVEWADKVRRRWPLVGWFVTFTRCDSSSRLIHIRHFGSVPVQ